MRKFSGTIKAAASSFPSPAGQSRLRDAAGVLKTVSDWKFEADQMMYQDKESRKMREK